MTAELMQRFKAVWPYKIIDCPDHGYVVRLGDDPEECDEDYLYADATPEHGHIHLADVLRREILQMGYAVSLEWQPDSDEVAIHFAPVGTELYLGQLPGFAEDTLSAVMAAYCVVREANAQGGEK
jgi:hypothetical protein